MIKVVLKIHDFDELSSVAKVFKLQAGSFLSPRPQSVFWEYSISSTCGLFLTAEIQSQALLISISKRV